MRPFVAAPSSTKKRGKNWTVSKERWGTERFPGDNAQTFDRPPATLQGKGACEFPRTPAALVGLINRTSLGLLGPPLVPWCHRLVVGPQPALLGLRLRFHVGVLLASTWLQFLGLAPEVPRHPSPDLL